MKNFLTLKNIIVYGTVIVLAVIVVLQTMTDYKVFPTKEGDTQGSSRVVPQLEAGTTCKGEPIYVDYKWPHSENGDNFSNPWECQIQCQDEKRHYIYYQNGLGTQCDVLPECLDLGEDQNVTCNPPEGDIPNEE